MSVEGEKPAEWAVFEQKNALRATMRRQLESMDPGVRRERSRALVARLTGLPEWKAGAPGAAVRAVAGRAGH